MNLQQLEYIIAVDRFRNFSRAAEHCHITQATLSAMIKKLESELDVVIFDRKANPIMTTEIGIDIINESRQIIALSQQIKLSKNKESKIEGTLKIGIIPTIAGTLIPQIIHPLKTTFPYLNLDITEVTTSHIRKLLMEGKIDAAILATPTDFNDVEEEILYYETLMVYGKLNKKKKYLMPEELRDEKIWLLEEGHCLREQFIQLCSLRKMNHQMTQLKFEPSSFDSLLNMVDSLGGLTLIPELYYLSLNKERQKLVTMFTSPYPVREVSMIYYRPYAKSKLITALAALIRDTTKPTLISSQLNKKDLLIAQM
jgi:LysR family hydrogen peroxide-inducible transcriptional activator